MQTPELRHGEDKHGEPGNDDDDDDDDSVLISLFFKFCLRAIE
jgi:hypothetical protein